MLTSCFSGLLFLPSSDVEHGVYEVEQDIVPKDFVTQVIRQCIIKTKHSLARLDTYERDDELIWERWNPQKCLMPEGWS